MHHNHHIRCRMQLLCPLCNTVRSGHFCICNCVRGYAKTVRRTCTWLYMYVCARVSERAFSEPMICSIPNGWIFPMSSMTCTKSFFFKWRTRSVDQGRLIYCKDCFARGRTQLHMQMCQGGHIALCSGVRADTIAYAKPSGGHYCIRNNVLRIVLHRGHNCIRHRSTVQYPQRYTSKCDVFYMNKFLPVNTYDFRRAMTKRDVFSLVTSTTVFPCFTKRLPL